MKWIAEEERAVVGTFLKMSAGRIGKDLLLCVEGGDTPHIGCAVQAVPRPSLAGDGKRSATASVWNLTGHKDEFLCRRLAEKVCKELGVTVVCTGGFHLEHISKEQIAEVMKAADEMGEVILERLLEKESLL